MSDCVRSTRYLSLWSKGTHLSSEKKMNLVTPFFEVVFYISSRFDASRLFTQESSLFKNQVSLYARNSACSTIKFACSTIKFKLRNQVYAQESINCAMSQLVPFLPLDSFDLEKPVCNRVLLQAQYKIVFLTSCTRNVFKLAIVNSEIFLPISSFFTINIF
jgi:hypothetical protein